MTQSHTNTIFELHRLYLIQVLIYLKFSIECNFKIIKNWKLFFIFSYFSQWLWYIISRKEVRIERYLIKLFFTLMNFELLIKISNKICYHNTFFYQLLIFEKFVIIILFSTFQYLKENKFEEKNVWEQVKNILYKKKS